MQAGPAQDITYNFVNYPADQTDIATGQQDAISGYITTDGSMGLLSPSDIVSWSFTINRGTAGSLGPYTYTGSNLTSGTLSPGMAQMILVGGPVATPTQLVLYGDYQSVSQGYFDGCELGLYYGIDSGDIYAANLNYFNSPGYYEHYLGTIDTTGAVSIAGWNTVSPEMNDS